MQAVKQTGTSQKRGSQAARRPRNWVVLIGLRKRVSHTDSSCSTLSARNGPQQISTTKCLFEPTKKERLNSIFGEAQTHERVSRSREHIAPTIRPTELPSKPSLIENESKQMLFDWTEIQTNYLLSRFARSCRMRPV